MKVKPMTMPLAELQEKVQSQKTLIPSLYGEVDFSITPERFTDDINIDSSMPGKMAKKHRKDFLADKEEVERFRAYTMLGDTVADAYAALLPEYGLPKLISMLKQACDEGIDSVDKAPQELKDFMEALETVPDWVDMDLVEQGARASRIHMATIVPYALRGTFIATFMNKYSGLPMALTGSLANESSVQRVNETGSFFTTASLPGALKRDGVAFKAAAMVRLMHSMVRFNILKRSDKWDIETYGIPIPQVDQMPAGTIPAFLTAFRAMSKGRKTFTKRERGIIELCRYQSYLLGLPEDLLPSTPEGIVKITMTYAATLRDGYDDSTCGELTRATINSYRPKDKSLRSRIYNEVERSFSIVFFSRVFLANNEKNMAKIMGVEASAKDYLLFALASLYVTPQIAAHTIALNIPGVSQLADKNLIHRINKLLVEYGHAEYTTDAEKYKPAVA
jgi:hypothetical protein